jgi:hypothetical protein
MRRSQTFARSPPNAQVKPKAVVGAPMKSLVFAICRRRTIFPKLYTTKWLIRSLDIMCNSRNERANPLSPSPLA